ncbi:endothelin-converting enzyme homolog [Aplysia californica]|uniref:Endothelin-converting enzyme homolog n=1 Tax=Aplysia californica TaxID=6500 RepID=A0ABM1A4L0_APLCA|nr:endothelin-converting enzyme homolog [Aplysia californica]
MKKTINKKTYCILITPPPPPEEVAVTTPVEQPQPVIPPDAPPPRQGCMEKRSCIEKLLIVLLIIIIIICLAFVAAFIVFYLFAAPPEGTCLTEECVSAASRLKSYMDDSVEPCNNFYEYACGGWLKKQVLEPDELKKDVGTSIGDANRIKIKSLLEVSSRANDSDYKVKPRAFYKACINEDKLEKRGSRPFFALLNEVGPFPALDPNWNETKFSLEETLVNLAKLALMPIVTVAVQRDLKDTQVNRIYVADAALSLGSRKKYERGREDPRVKHYETWLVKNLEMLGADPEEAKQDVAAIIDLEIHIARLMRDDVEKKDMSSSYNSMTIAMLQSKYPWLNWLEFLQGFASDPQQGGGVYVGVEETVINTEPAYLEQLGNLLKNTSQRVLANYVMSHMVKFTSALGPKYVALYDEKNKAVLGIEPAPRWERCANEATSIFPEAVSRMYVDQFFSKDAKKYMKTMIQDLTVAFRELLEENNWMGKDTKEKANEKLKQMGNKIGYPDYLLKDDRLNTLYQKISADEGKYMETIRDYKLFVTLENVKKLREPKDKSKWDIHPATVNAHYNVLDNEIIFPAAFLQAPVYDPGYSSSMNYGSAGFSIGAEVVKAFDLKGSQYNPKGELKSWWTSKDKENFKSRSQCFVDQYGCYKWDGNSIDGELTLGENIADNGGLKQSYRAYRNLVARQGTEEKRLPGLKLNHDQIFFLSFAQVWCAKIRDEVKKGVVESDPHSPPPYRVYGTLQNSVDFSRAFNCPVGSRMNPMRKCVLW